MEFNEILKDCYKCFLDKSRDYEKLCELFDGTIEYIDIYDRLNNLIRIDYSNNEYTLEPKFVEFVNNFIKLKKREILIKKIEKEKNLLMLIYFLLNYLV